MWESGLDGDGMEEAGKVMQAEKSTLEGTGTDGPASSVVGVGDMLCRRAEAGGGRTGRGRVSEASLGPVLLLWAYVRDGALRHGSIPPGGGPAFLGSQGFWVFIPSVPPARALTTGCAPLPALSPAA